jgi:valyl-tRNA synthetase
MRAMIEQNRGAIERLASVDAITFVEASLEKVAGARSTSRFDVHTIYEKKIDVAAERERLTKELEKIEKQLASAHARLSDDQFLKKAPSHVVEGLRKQVEELTALRDKILAKLKELGAAGTT